CKKCGQRIQIPPPDPRQRRSKTVLGEYLPPAAPEPAPAEELGQRPDKSRADSASVPPELPRRKVVPKREEPETEYPRHRVPTDDDSPSRRRRTSGSLMIGLAVGGSVLVLLVAGVIVLVFAASVNKGILPLQSEPSLPNGNTTTFLGRTADSWGPELLDADRIVSRDASNALAMLGDDALRWWV